MRLGHYSIRTQDLEASQLFYTKALGLRVGFRPPFNFPGIWLYADEDESDFGMVHIIGVDPNNAAGLADYLGDRGADVLTGSGALDHMAFLASDLVDAKARFTRLNIAFTERVVPSLGLCQLFIVDPSGITIELNYPHTEAA
jgi:catechol 2,3-dioxygenase-like lactoylglutathione lyase family enzyme